MREEAFSFPSDQIESVPSLVLTAALARNVWRLIRDAAVIRSTRRRVARNTGTGRAATAKIASAADSDQSVTIFGKSMDNDPLCKGCGHPISVHIMRRPEKRTRIAGTMVSDFPSGREEQFNPHSGRSDDACSEADCSCLAFVSPFVR
jgi:hypothetical protein